MAVGAFYDVMPEGPDVDMEQLMIKIRNSVPDGIDIAEIKVEPVAFGLKKIVLSTVMDDAEGLVDSLENALLSVEGVQSAECIATTLL